MKKMHSLTDAERHDRKNRLRRIRRRKARIYQLVQEGMSFEQAALHFDVSPNTAIRYYREYVRTKVAPTLIADVMASLNITGTGMDTDELEDMLE